MNIIITEQQYKQIQYKILIDALVDLFEDIEDDDGVVYTPPTKNKKEN